MFSVCCQELDQHVYQRTEQPDIYTWYVSVCVRVRVESVCSVCVVSSVRASSVCSFVRASSVCSFVRACVHERISVHMCVCVGVRASCTHEKICV